MSSGGVKAKNLEEIGPITHGIVAKTHTPIYRMHRYFAKRPHNVFRYLIEHYSNPTDTILDPFCGGGVTVVEGLRLGRKVIGVDFNPVATFLTRMEVTPVPVEKLKKAFDTIRISIEKEILEMYHSKCPKCNRSATGEWFEWSCVCPCPECKKEVVIAEAKKVEPGKPGVYACPYCGDGEILYTKGDRDRDVIVRIKISCSNCGTSIEKTPDNVDIEHSRRIESSFEDAVKERGLWFPDDQMPMDFDLRRPYNRMFGSFSEFFTKRNLLALSILYGEVIKVKDKTTRLHLLLTFSSTLDYSSRISRVVQGAGREITTATYWVGARPAENNVWRSFEKRFKALIRGKEYAWTEIGDKFKEAKTFQDLRNEKTCLILTQSSTDLGQVDDGSVDTVITDPPYGGNVMYSELSDFWVVWLKNELGIEGLIDNREEAIKSKVQKKGDDEYRNLLFKVMKECHRVLKPNRWLVMTFHNKEIAVWNALLIAAHDAGFVLPEENGVIYQPPIRAYTTTLHQKRGGAMLGDFILSFKRSDKPPVELKIEKKDIEDKIANQVRKVIRYHGGASINKIYMQLMPFLTNEGLLHKMAQKDLEPFLKRHFTKKRELWFLREDVDKEGNVRLFDVIPAEQRIEQLIRSILKEKKKATIDEIYEGLYTNLTNGMTPDTEDIMIVLNRIARRTTTESKKREVWELDTQTTIFAFPKKLEGVSEDNLHDQIISRLATLGLEKGHEVHIGKTEQRKNESFKEISIPMADDVQFGISKEALNIIREIDLLWLKKNTIVSAFEVEKSSTIDSGINRFRNLLVTTPNLTVDMFIVAPDSREREAIRKINSPANKKEGIDRKVRLMRFSEIVGDQT